MNFINRLFFLSFFAVFGISTSVICGSAKAEEDTNPYEMNAQKASIPPEKMNKAQNIIQQQLKAISDRDAHKAFDFMTEHSHKNYDDAQDFLSDMRFEFGPIYNHMDIEFLHHYENGTVSVQKVSLKDRYSGDNFTVIYKLQLQDNGTLLIDSFSILNFEEAQPI